MGKATTGCAKNGQTSSTLGLSAGTLLLGAGRTDVRGSRLGIVAHDQLRLQEVNRATDILAKLLIDESSFAHVKRLRYASTFAVESSVAVCSSVITVPDMRSCQVRPS